MGSVIKIYFNTLRASQRSLFWTMFLIFYCSFLNCQVSEKDSLLKRYIELSPLTYSPKNVSLLNELSKKYRFRNPDSLKLFAGELLRLAQKKGDKNDIAIAKLRIGTYYSDIGKNPTALKKYFEAEELSQEINNPRTRIDLFTQLSIEYFFIRRFDKSLAAAYKGIELSKQNGLLATEARLRHILGFIYTQNKLYQEAESELKKAISLWKIKRDSVNLYGSRSNLARNSILAGNLEKAERFFEGNIDFFQRKDEKLWLARSYMVQSHIELKKQNFEKALWSNQQYDSVLLKLNTPRDRILAYNNYSELYYLQKDYEKATLYADSTIHYSLRLKDSVELLNGYESMAKIAMEKANYDLATKYSSLALPIKKLLDQKYRDDNLKLIRAKQELEFEQLEKELLNEEKLMRQRRITAIVLVLVVLSVGFLFWGRQTVLSRKSTNKKLQNLNRTKDRLFSIIGHELKSPIGTLQELLSLYDEKAIPKNEVSKAIPRLKQKVDYSAITLNNLLFWAKKQMKGIEPQPNKVPIKKMANSICERFNSQLDKKKVSIICHISNDLSLRADPTHLEIILRNIISNAIKFTHEGGRIVFSSKEKDRIAEVSISDNGMGMNEQTVKNLLLDDHIEPEKGTLNEKGVGLGFLIAKELVQLNNGRLNIDSKLGMGSTVRIILPVYKS